MPDQENDWKRQFLAQLAELFAGGGGAGTMPGPEGPWTGRVPPMSYRYGQLPAPALPGPEGPWTGRVPSMGYRYGQPGAVAPPSAQPGGIGGPNLAQIVSHLLTLFG